VKELKVIRDDHMNVMAEAAKPNSTVDMAEYLWQVKMPVLQL
jgi:hypothetical protein